MESPFRPLVRTWQWAKRNRMVAALLATLFAALLGLGGSLYFVHEVTQSARQHAIAQTANLQTAAPTAVPLLIQNLREFRRDVIPHLQRAIQHELPSQERVRLQMALVALRDEDGTDPTELVVTLIEELLTAPPGEFLVLRDLLGHYASKEVDSHLESLWRRTRDDTATKSVRFRAACALARFNPDSPHWPSVARDLVGRLITENRLAITVWIESLTPVREFLTPHLLRQFRQAEDLQHREVAAAVLAELYSDDNRRLVELAFEAEPRQLAELLPPLRSSAKQATPFLFPLSRTNPPHIEAWFEHEAGAESGPTDHAPRPALREREASRLANVEITLAALGVPEPLWSRLAHNQYPTTRSWIIHRAGQAGIDPHVFKSRIAPLAHNQEAGVELTGHLLALGRFSPGQLYLSERRALLPQLLQLYREHPHPGVHSAAHWLLHVWGFDNEREKVVLAPESNPTMRSRGQPWWFATPSQITMVAHGPVDDFSMGTDEPASGRMDVPSRHRRSIPRGFALATRPVTVAEFQRFEVHRLKTLGERLEIARRDGDQMAVDELESRIKTVERQRRNRRGAAEREHPIVDVNWYESAAFCHWLGKQEEIPVEQQYYPDPDELLDAYIQSQPIHISPEALRGRTGYRLPTSAEWEFMCRAGAASDHPLGYVDPDVLTEYNWNLENSPQSTAPVARRKPNDWGLFDLLGNACDWCDNWFLDTPQPNEAGLVVDGLDSRCGGRREVRGGSHRNFAGEVHASTRIPLRPEQSDETVGFRVARTLLPLED